MLYRREPVLTVTGAVLVLAVIPLAMASIMDARTLNGAPVWDKPARFALALGVYLLTLAFFTGWMQRGARHTPLMRWGMAAGVTAIMFEQFWITFQAARGLPSHFNYATGFETTMWALMGIGAVILTLMAPIIGWLIWRRPLPGLEPALRASAALGLILTFPLTIITAGTMAAHGSHFVGDAGSAASGLFLMAWSRESGDLRVPHFFATHIMHVVPIAVAVLMPVFGGTRIWPVLGVTALYVLFVAAVFAQALAGLPFI
jgi:hypothetical protein